EVTPLSSQATASPSMMQECERRRANVSTDQRKAIGEFIAREAVEPHLCALLAGNDPKAVMLDLVQPLAARVPDPVLPRLDRRSRLGLRRSRPWFDRKDGHRHRNGHPEDEREPRSGCHVRLLVSKDTFLSSYGS